MSTASAVVEPDFGLSEELVLLRDQVRRFAAERIAPCASDIDRTNRFPRDLWPELGELGLLGITVDPEFGGAGLGVLAHVVAMEEISRASAAVGLSYAAHSNLCVNQLARWGSDAQKRHFLPDLVAGRHVGALAISEPQAGSDVLGMRTLATPAETFAAPTLGGNDVSADQNSEPGGYLLNGTKMWITNGPEADIVIVYGRVTDTAGPPHVERSTPIKAFIVEKTLPGYSTEPKLDKLGMRGSDTSGLVFRDCRVPATHVLPGDGKEILMTGLDTERIVLAGGPLGIMLACLDLALPYAHARKQFDRPIGEFQLMQAKLADMYVAANASRAFVYAVAAACDRGRVSRHDAAAAILQASEAATWAAGQTIQTLGGNGYTSEYAAGRLWRDAKLYEIGAGTNEIRRMLIGRELFAATREGQ